MGATTATVTKCGNLKNHINHFNNMILGNDGKHGDYRKNQIKHINNTVLEIRALLRYSVASCGNCLSKLRDNVSVPS